MTDTTTPAAGGRTTKTLESAARSLVNSVYGLAFAELELREAIGNTNWAVLQQHAAELDALLALPEGREQPDVDQCPAKDYPVWADGSQDLVSCTLPVRHEGPHCGLIGTHEWRF